MKSTLLLSVIHQIRNNGEHIYIGFLERCAPNQLLILRTDPTGGGLVPGRDYEVLGDTTETSLERVKRAFRAEDVETIVWQRLRTRPGKVAWVREE